MQQDQNVTIPIVIELSQSLDALVGVDEVRTCERHLCNMLSTHLDRLGLQGKPSIEFRQVNSSRAVRLRVHGRLQPYTPDLMQRTWFAVAPASLRGLPENGTSAHQSGFADAWFKVYVTNLSSSGNQTDWRLTFEYLARLAIEIILAHPDCLVGHAQAAAYVQNTQRMLADKIDLGISKTLPKFEEHNEGLEKPDFIPDHPRDDGIVPTLVRRMLSNWIGTNNHSETSSVTQTSPGSRQAHDHETSILSIDLQPVLQSLLNLGVSLADTSTIAQAIHSCHILGRSSEEVVEVAFARLRSHRIEIHVHPTYLRDLVPGALIREPLSVYADQIDESIYALFRSMEEDLFAEMGIRLPDLFWIPSVKIHEGMIAFKINDRLGLPVGGLQPGEPEFAIQALTDEIRRMAARLLSIEDVEYQLALLGEVFPELIQTTMVCHSLAHITTVLRGMLREGLSIRDLRTILERMLQYDYIPIASLEHIALDERFELAADTVSDSANIWPNYYEFVRGGMKYAISQRYTRNQKTLIAYVIDRDLEARMEQMAMNRDKDNGTAELNEDEQEALRNAIWIEIAGVTTATHPVLLTTSHARPALRKLIAAELPGMSIVAYAELLPNVDIQPAGTISLSR
jgi:hypothetical protein